MRMGERGSLAGMAQVVAGHPLDTIKARDTMFNDVIRRACRLRERVDASVDLWIVLCRLCDTKEYVGCTRAWARHSWAYRP
jgi:hypothetical protein